MVKKGVFAEQLDDIDDFMPQRPERPSVEDPAELEPIGQEGAGDEAAEADDDLPGPDQPVAVGDSRLIPPRRRRATSSVPTAEVAPQLHRLLRRLTNKERSKDPITARTYAQVVLDAIEAHQEQLATHWRMEASGAQGGGGLFSRRPAAPARRRRHAEPPARVPLTGLNRADGQVLDRLVTTWNAPSRSALVEQALRFYLNAD